MRETPDGQLRETRIFPIPGAAQSSQAMWGRELNERESAVNQLFFKNLLPGTLLFSRFTLERCLSAGPVGGVYLCTDALEQRGQVALKVFSVRALKEQGLLESFERERELSCLVRHDNVIASQAVFHDDEFSAFAMEFIDNGTLADLIAQEQQISIHRISEMLSQIAAGLKAIHAAGIVHRDLKPENILISSSGKVKISDFGIAAAAGGIDSAPQEGLSGTVNYLAPEYIASGHFDYRSDIYALGVIAYELMTGHVPFNGGGLIDALISRVRFDPAAPRAMRTDIPRALSDLALKAMSRFPGRRHQSADEFLSHLHMIKIFDVEVSARKQSLIIRSLNQIYTRRPVEVPEAA